MMKIFLWEIWKQKNCKKLNYTIHIAESSWDFQLSRNNESSINCKNETYLNIIFELLQK